jgi:hypothetical protein
MKMNITNKILLIIGILSIGSQGCAPPQPDVSMYSSFQSRAYELVTVKPKEKVTIAFDVFEVDDFVTWDVDWKPLDVKLVDPRGNYYSWRLARDPIEGFDTVMHFDVTDPIPGTWQMIISSKGIQPIYCSVSMGAYSLEKDAYPKR